MSVFPSPLLDAFSALVDRLAALLQPAFGGAATAVAVIAFTVLVRLAAHPLSRAAVRGQQARVRLRSTPTARRPSASSTPSRKRSSASAPRSSSP
ncbi:hypothetical protein ACFC05_32490, partial [Streptomyces hydrogenans]